MRCFCDIFGLTYTRRGYTIKNKDKNFFGRNEVVENDKNINEKTCCCHKTKERSEIELKSLMNRLSRIEGQIRGIKGMLERDVYCTDILVQVAAANAALNGFSRELLGNHIRTCVAEDIREGKDESIEELVALLPKLMK